MLKLHETCFRWMPMSTQADKHKLKKMLQPIKGTFSKKIGLKLQNPKSKFQNTKFNILYKTAFWNKQKWLKTIIGLNFSRNWNYAEN